MGSKIKAYNSNTIKSSSSIVIAVKYSSHISCRLHLWAAKGSFSIKHAQHTHARTTHTHTRAHYTHQLALHLLGGLLEGHVNWGVLSKVGRLGPQDDL